MIVTFVNSFLKDYDPFEVLRAFMVCFDRHWAKGAPMRFEFVPHMNGALPYRLLQPGNIAIIEAVDLDSFLITMCNYINGGGNISLIEFFNEVEQEL